MTDQRLKHFRNIRRVSLALVIAAVVAVGACGNDTPTDTCSTDTEATLATTTFDPSVNVDVGSLVEVSGVFIHDRTIGTDPAAGAGDVVEMNYEGRLPDGTLFDAGTYPFILALGNAILGWHVGIDGMQQGGTRQLVIPPSSGYGLCGFGAIPGNSFLIFEVELATLTPSS